MIPLLTGPDMPAYVYPILLYLTAAAIWVFKTIEDYGYGKTAHRRFWLTPVWLPVMLWWAVRWLATKLARSFRFAWMGDSK